MVIEQIPCLKPPRTVVLPRATIRQMGPERPVRIATTFSSAVQSDLTKARIAWVRYQSTRQRDAVYGYLSVVFDVVQHWKKLGRVKACLHEALSITKCRDKMRSREPFGVVIFCTSDTRVMDGKTRSKWSRALRYACEFKPDGQGLAPFIRSKGGINECAGLWSFKKAKARSNSTGYC